MKKRFTGLIVFLFLAACTAENKPAEELHSEAPIADFSPRAKAKYTELSATDKARMLPDANSSDAVKRGYKVFMSKCVTCHGSGFEKGATIRLEDRYEGEVPAVLALRTDLFADQIEMFVRTDTVGMPPFRFTEIDDETLDDLVAYLTRLNPDEAK